MTAPEGPRPDQTSSQHHQLNLSAHREHRLDDFIPVTRRTYQERLIRMRRVVENVVRWSELVLEFVYLFGVV